MSTELTLPKRELTRLRQVARVEISDFIPTILSELSIRDSNGEILPLLVSKFYQEALSEVLRRNGLELRGKAYLAFATCAFADYAALLQLTEIEKKKCWQYFLDD